MKDPLADADEWKGKIGKNRLDRTDKTYLDI